MIDDAALDSGASVVPGSAMLSVSLVPIMTGVPSAPTTPIFYSASLSIQSEVVDIGLLFDQFFPRIGDDGRQGEVFNPRIVPSRENQGVVGFQQSCEQLTASLV